MSKKIFTMIFMLLALVVSGCSSETVKPEVEVFEEKYPTYLSESIGYMVSYDRTGKVKTGYTSAFIYDQSASHSYVLTSNAIIKDTYTYKFYVGNKVLDCTYIGSDSYLNVAILSFETMAHKVSKVDNGNYDNMLVGNSVYVPILGSYASHLDNQVTLSKGIVSSRSVTYCTNDYLFSCNNYMISDAVSVDTSKGAPVLDYYGNLIGVVAHIKHGEDNDALSYVVPEDVLKDAIDDILKTQKPSKADLHIEFGLYENLSLEVKEQVMLSDVESTDIIIKKVTGYAESVQVPVYSRVVSVDGTKVTSLNHLVDLLYDYKQGDVVKLEVESETGTTSKFNIKL